MAEIKTVLGEIYAGLKPALTECGFKDAACADSESGIPVSSEGDKTYLEFVGENKGLKVEYSNSRIYLMGVNKEGEILSSDYVQLALSLFEPDEATAKDIRYIVNDFSDTITENFGSKAKKQVKSKLPTPVSKADAKSGAVSYDPNTLANRFTTIYPELREEYKANCEKYGQFLPEDFFVNYGTKAAIDTIKKNNPAEMKKLFKLLNDIYEDGTNETQSLICVTILGALENDTQLLANCVDYMCDDLTNPVIQVNKYLWSKDGKGARMKLENPPRYKPKKAKKSKINSTLGM